MLDRNSIKPVTYSVAELAHQWFGDYVTCRSWADLWLNESFATYFQPFGMSTILEKTIPFTSMLK